jgi:hypothetical protein
MDSTSFGRRLMGGGVTCLMVAMMIPVHGAEPQELDGNLANKKEMPGSPGTKNPQDGYDAAVRKCQSQAGQAKQECIENAKTKYGEMLK